MKKTVKAAFTVLAAGLMMQSCSQSVSPTLAEVEETVQLNFTYGTPTAKQDSLALVALYRSTDGEGWNRSGRWLTKAPVSNWRGVTTEEIDGEMRVVKLRLGANRMDGKLPKEIGDLTKLRVFEVGYNYSLTGPLIDEFYNLKELEVLKMSFTSIVGELSPKVGNLTELDTLDLWTSPWEQFSASWDKNELVMTGELPKELGKLSKVRYVRFGRQDFSGELPEEMGNMANLEFLDIADCKLTGGIPASFGNLKKLKTFFIAKNKLNKPLPPELGDAISLYEFYAGENEIPGEIPSEFGKLKNLSAIELSDNKLTGEIPATLADIERLALVYLHNNNLSGCIPANLGGEKQLRLLHVSLNNNNLVGEVPARVPHEYFGGYVYTTFDVVGNKLEGTLSDLYLMYEENYKNFVPQQDGYGFTNLTKDGIRK